MNEYLEEIIRTLPELEYLNISQNQLRYLPESFGEVRLSKLQVLDISGNDLHYLPKRFGLAGLARLNSLNIKGNPKLLTDPESKRILDILSQGRKDLNIEGNPRVVSVLKD